jgi:hypothetical protein
MKNRKREICTSGSVRDEAGQPPHLLGGSGVWRRGPWWRGRSSGRCRWSYSSMGDPPKVRWFICPFFGGLGETDYVEGRNVTVEYHYLEGQFE